MNIFDNKKKCFVGAWMILDLKCWKALAENLGEKK